MEGGLERRERERDVRQRRKKGERSQFVSSGVCLNVQLLVCRQKKTQRVGGERLKSSRDRSMDSCADYYVPPKEGSGEENTLCVCVCVFSLCRDMLSLHIAAPNNT